MARIARIDLGGGAVLIWRDASIDSGEPIRPAESGDGCFSTIGCRAGRPLLWHAHEQRMKRDFASLFPGVAAPKLPSRQQLSQYLLDCGLEDLAVLRLVIAQRDGVPFVEMSAEPFVSKGVSAEALRLGTVKLPGRPLLLDCKSLSRAPWSRAARQARSLGFDDALLCVDEGDRTMLLETSVANLVARCGQTLMLPRPGLDALPGTMQAWILARADELGLGIDDHGLDLSSAQNADELIVCNALRGAVAVSSIDDHELATASLPDRLVNLGLPAPGWPLPSSSY